MEKNGESGNSQNDLLKKAAPLFGAGVAALPFITAKRKGKAISQNISFPESKNGIFVPNAYFKYNLYDSKGILLKSGYQSIDKQAKDAWQKLYLYEEVQQNGFVQIELGNDSKKPVWMDGISLKRSAFNSRIKIPKDTISNPSDSLKVSGDMPVTTLGGGGDCFTDPCDKGDGGDGDSGGDGYAWTVILLDGPIITAPDPVSGIGGSTFLGYSGGSPTYHYSPKTEKERLEQFEEGYYMATSHPGQKDWSRMTNNERLTHILKAFKYAQKNKISLNLNHYFKNLPVKGNSGFGKQYKISGSVIINGQSIPITMELPIISSERIIRVDIGPDVSNISDHYASYGPTNIYRYGLNGNPGINTFTIYTSQQHDDRLYDFIRYP